MRETGGQTPEPMGPPYQGSTYANSDTFSSELEAIVFASRWAATTKQSNPWAAEYARRWYNDPDNTYKLKDGLHDDLEHFRASRQNSIEYWRRKADSSHESRREWAIEAIKQLAFLNGAGIAGMATLIATSKPVLWHYPAALSLFGLGLFGAVASLLVGTSGHAMLAKLEEHIWHKMWMAKDWDEQEKASKEFEPSLPKKWFIALGWLVTVVIALSLAGVVTAAVGVTKS